ncbi:hypothetical protein [Fundicoccus culcitae]|uniref:Uncharacterized protein n=1 Tax=Fundicoccus culcitae TaxID=2969821 RepID=A0ABY5P6J3_9LACT|nr:hypothetical protein [Fundicoccus culcitae]UUX34169.1 hypothetical protein NRE15_00420 [Fundicoccus culcitae]
MNHYNSDEEKKAQRMLIVNISISLIIQLAILLVYYFGEKQTLLTFPMLLGLLITVNALVQSVQAYRRH